MKINFKETIMFVVFTFAFFALLAEGLIHQLDIEAAACEQQK